MGNRCIENMMVEWAIGHTRKGERNGKSRYQDGQNGNVG